MFHLIGQNKRPCFWAEFPVTVTLIPFYFLRPLMKTLINIGVQSRFRRSQLSKNKNFKRSKRSEGFKISNLTILLSLHINCWGGKTNRFFEVTKHSNPTLQQQNRQKLYKTRRSLSTGIVSAQKVSQSGMKSTCNTRDQLTF